MHVIRLALAVVLTAIAVAKTSVAASERLLVPESPLPNKISSVFGNSVDERNIISSAAFDKELFHGKATYYGTPPMPQFDSVHCSLRKL
jgi:hypothetical protein